MKGLLEQGASLTVFDPEAMENIEKQFGNSLEYANSMYEAIEGADALIICTEWSIFRTPNLEKLKASLNNAVVFDGRNLYDTAEMKQEGFTYISIGR
ncbi:MAG: UDPglucose 6-dehydrogenase [Patiriisocius sp.]|jgi:UDPglucose 6-dehydrogenase